MGSLNDSHQGVEGGEGHVLHGPVPKEATTEGERHRETHGNRYHDHHLASDKSVQVTGSHVENDVAKSKGERYDSEQAYEDTCSRNQW